MASAVHPIHPFPARMAPEIALAEVASLAPYSRVLDPMAGSGTVLRVASDQSHQCLGFDMDPLAVLMTRVWTTPISVQKLLSVAEQVMKQTEILNETDVTLPWIDEDIETHDFIEYWFAKQQQTDLRKLCSIIRGVDGPIGDALRIALSRLIITKDHGASLARDISHSRPHRVRTVNDFNIVKEFRRSVNYIANNIYKYPPRGNVTTCIGDARHLDTIEDESIDVIITSPPYLNAIDYMRGHRLTLVWLGYRLSDLRAVRSESTGSERMASGDRLKLAEDIRKEMMMVDVLPKREQRILDRYILDMYDTVTEFSRVLHPHGRVVMVVGNSCIKGIYVNNATAITCAMERIGFRLLERRERELPPNRRYLPPPSNLPCGDLEKRMRTEAILSLERI